MGKENKPLTAEAVMLYPTQTPRNIHANDSDGRGRGIECLDCAFRTLEANANYDRKAQEFYINNFRTSPDTHINYTSARNTLHGIKITVDSIADFRSLNSLLIKSNIPFHTYALEEERKIKAVLRNIPLEISTDCIKSDLESQNYPVFAVHRMHRRDGTVIGHVLAVLHKSDTAKDIFKSPPKVCGLSGIIVEAPYRKSGPGQCYRCQLYGHAAQNCYAQPAVSNAANRTQQRVQTLQRLCKPPSQSLITKIFPPWPGKLRVTSHAVSRPATNAWSRTPARAESEPAKAIREPQAGLSQTGISCRPTAETSSPSCRC
ncbi:hypothetical protein EVAR_28734_1 [Eumeta japonica]|uniref:Nucleic-acid-binding protein from transposon X-element n=1 Tax=Eumeta variegata TaxID=151549 RepID=A0A4C1V451_EUMVA|nr:hypothetical protein EVAR_28734_1 [Eumeta japonica]